ncbi:Macrolide export protein MacA [compost metagenome]
MQQIERNKQSRQTKIKILASMFFGLLIVFTLFSNTLLTLTLPKVATEIAKKGPMSYMFKGSGVVKPRESIDLTQNEGWKVQKVHVKKGDKVAKGQLLVSYDSTEAQWQIEEAQASLMMLQLAAEDLQSTFKETMQDDHQMDIKKAKNALESNKIDQSIQIKLIDRLQSKLATNSKLIAPFEGLILSVNTREGLTSNSAGADIRMTNESSGFEFELQIPAQVAEKMKIDDKLNVSLEDDPTLQLEGQIVDIQNSKSAAGGSDMEPNHVKNPSPQKEVHIALQDEKLKGGEQAQVNVLQSSKADMLLISHQAIHEDQDGSYVFTIEERSGPLGNAFYAIKNYVTVTEDNGKVSAISQGLFDQSQVIVESSEPLHDGSRIRI